jgi:hypothetical protein
MHVKPHANILRSLVLDIFVTTLLSLLNIKQNFQNSQISSPTSSTFRQNIKFDP